MDLPECQANSQLAAAGGRQHAEYHLRRSAVISPGDRLWPDFMSALASSI